MAKLSMNRFFESWARAVMRYRWLAILLFVGVLAVSAYLARQVKADADFTNYFVEDDPMIVRTEEFNDIFGNDIFAGVLVRCDDVYRPENLRLIRELSQELEDSLMYAERVLSLTHMDFMRNEEGVVVIGPLVPDEIADRPAFGDSIRRVYASRPQLRNWLVSDDGREAWIFVKLSPFPAYGPDGKAFHDIIGGKQEEIIKQAKYASLHPLGTGLPYVGYKKNLFFAQEAPRVFLLSVVLALLVLALVTRSLRGMLLPILCSIGGIFFLFGVVVLVDYHPDPNLMVVPIVMAFAIPLAYNIHVYSLFRQRFYATGRRRESVVETMEEVAWPVLISALTTIAALLTFIFTPVDPLRFIGFGTAIAIGFAFVSLALLFPSLMSFGRDREPRALYREGNAWWDRRLTALARWVLAHPKPILLVSLPLLAIMLYGATLVRISFDPKTTIGERVEYVRDILAISDSQIGSLYTYNLLVDLGEPGRAKEPENLRRLDRLTERIEKELALTMRTNSIVRIVKDLNSTLNDGTQATYAIPQTEEELAQLLLLYENAGGTEAEYWMDYDYRRLRLMVEISDFDSQVCEDELARVQTFAQEIFPDADVQVVGMLPQFITMMQYVARGQISTFLLSLGIIALILMAVFGSVKVGLVGMIPNLAPAICVAGIMGYTGMPLDMITATIIPVILGISVDDTVQILNLARRQFLQHGSYAQAMNVSFRIAGRAVIFSTLIISANFGTFAISLSNNLLYLGILSVTGLVVALLADLFITPLILRKFKLFGPETDGGEV
ncbi:MAG: hypothetical protein CSA07_01330 [Bacteroidia bacterium]|nr:MAG: hypothetical protein CSA07_01330 [Bacteroidia bacterium]